MAEATRAAYPVTLTGNLDEPPSRWLFFFKWLLLVPHLIILLFLWVAFAVLTIFAFFAILFTGRYPRGMFDFNVGVLRWTWRVSFYGYGMLGTDKYPPFSLDSRDYPANLEIAYPERLHRGLVLVKWWLLALPHYVVVSIFGVGIGPPEGGGLANVLVFFAAIALLFTGKYPPDMFRLVIQMNRWTLRVGAYAALMTDEYPPFRLED